MKRYFLINLLSLFFLGAALGQSGLQLNDSSLVYFNKGDYNKAILFGEKAVELSKKELGDTSRDYATILNNLGFYYYSNYDYSKAEPLYLEALNIRKKLLGEEHPDYAITLNDLAGLYESMGNYSKAEPLYLEAIKIEKKVLGEEHPDYAISLNNLAYLYKSMGSYAKAEPLYQEAIKIEKKTLGENHPDYATSLNNLAFLYKSMGNYAKAEPLYQEAIKIEKKTLGENHPDYVISLNNLAHLYNNIGEYAKAKPLYVEALKIRKEILGVEHPDYVISLNNLAYLYSNIGDYAKAEPLYMEALNIRKKRLGEEHTDYGNILRNFADMYASMGLHTKAETLYLEALNIQKKVLGEEHTDYANTLNNLASLYKSMGNYAKAEPLYVEALNIQKKVLGEEHTDYANILNNLASLYESIGNYAKAEPLYVEALNIYKKLLGEENPSYATIVNNLAGLYSNMGNYTKAEPMHVESLNIRRMVLGESHPYYIYSLYDLAALYESVGNYDKAEPLRIKGFEIATNHILSNISNLSEKEKNVWISKNGYQNEILLSLQNNYKGIANTSTSFILNQQLLFKSLILADTKGILQTILTNKDSALQEIYSNWTSIKKQLAQQYSLPIAGRNTELADWEKKAEVLEKEINRKSSAFREQQQSFRIKSTDVQTGLSNNEASIEFVRFRLYNKKWTDSTMYAAYILTKNDSIPVFVPLFEEKQLQKLFDSAGTSANAMVSKFYRGVDLGNTGTSASLGKDLYNLVWAPLEPYLKGIKKISYSPAGKLYSIAFHALPVDSATMLMDKYELSQYTSTRQVALRRTQETKVNIQSVTLFGNASFTLDSATIAKAKTGNQSVSNIYVPQNRGSRGGTWSDLPGTAEEVKKLKQLFDQNRIPTKSFTQTTATEENLKALSGNSPQVLHIATHGFFLPDPEKKRKDIGMNNENTYSLADDPLLRSGLILAGGNYAWSGKTPVEGVEDGIATAYEISQLNLSNTELVVLSACETALGDVKGSEGVFGLQRAFKMAGVKKMIVSLWQVPDKETAELMTTFYNYWLKGKTIEQAFAQAQAEMRKKYSPYYWAAFVLVE